MWSWRWCLCTSTLVSMQASHAHSVPDFTENIPIHEVEFKKCSHYLHLLLWKMLTSGCWWCHIVVLGYRFTVVRASQGVSSCALPHRKQNGSGAGGGDGRGTIRCLHVFWSQTGTAAPPVRTDGSYWWTVLVMSSCFISTENLVFMQHLCVFSIYL